jgi:hypothetical protein
VCERVRECLCEGVLVCERVSCACVRVCEACSVQ